MRLQEVSPALHERLGREATLGLLALVDAAGENWRNAVTTEAVLRFEQRLSTEANSLRAEIRQLRDDMRVGDTQLRDEMRSGFAAARIELHQELSKQRVDMTGAMRKLHVGVMRWTISLWVGQVAATAAFIAAMFRIYSP